jgi:hypothetical protein
MRRALLLATMVLAFGCKEADPVRATVDQLAEAAESRDVGDVMKLIATTYPGRAEVEQTLRRYFFGYRAIDISIRNFAAEQGATTAAATFEVDFTGVPKEIGGMDQLLPRAARYRFDVQMVKEGNDWKIESAQYEQIERKAL